jgi:hypothetical protein
LARDPDAALALRPVTALAFERTDAGLLQLHGIERIDTGDLCVELRSGKFVERLKGAPRVRVPAAVGGVDQATDPSQFDLQQASAPMLVATGQPDVALSKPGLGPAPALGETTPPVRQATRTETLLLPI